MPLAIDASSPAASAVTTQSNTCAAFTPPDSPLWLGLWAGNTSGPVTNAFPTVSSSPTQTWVQDAYEASASGSPAENGQTAIAHVAVTGSPGSSTVTFVNAQTVGQWDSMLAVLVFTGHDPGGPVGAAGGGRQASGSTITASYTATIDGGWGFLVVCDWNANSMASVTPASGCTIREAGVIAGAISYLVVHRDTADGVSGNSTSLGVANLVTGGKYHWCYAEVISLEAAQAARDIFQGGAGSLVAKHHGAGW